MFHNRLDVVWTRYSVVTPLLALFLKDVLNKITLQKDAKFCLCDPETRTKTRWSRVQRFWVQSSRVLLSKIMLVEAKPTARPCWSPPQSFWVQFGVQNRNHAGAKLLSCRRKIVIMHVSCLGVASASGGWRCLATRPLALGGVSACIYAGIYAGIFAHIFARIFARTFHRSFRQHFRQHFRLHFRRRFRCHFCRRFRQRVGGLLYFLR